VNQPNLKGKLNFQSIQFCWMVVSLSFFVLPVWAQSESIALDSYCNPIVECVDSVYIEEDCVEVGVLTDSLAITEDCEPVKLDPQILIDAPKQLLYQEGGTTEFKRNQPFVGGWFFLINLFLMILFVVKMLFFGEYTKKSWNAWFNNNLFFQFTRDKRSMNAAIYSIETIFKLYTITVLFFLGKYLWTDQWQMSWSQFRNLMLILVVFLFIKQVITIFLSLLTDQLEEFRILELSNIVFTSNFFWFIIPSFIIIVYSELLLREYLIYVLFGAILIGFILYLYKNLVVALKMKIRFNIHFFIYLCALEILPFLFLGKTLQNFNF
jgi:hypothetical protein